MAITDESNGNGFYMPVAPAYGGNNSGFGGFGGDGGWWIILLFVLLGGWGGGMGGYGGMGGLYPWLNNSQNINDGFRDSMLNTGVTSIGDKVTSGFGDISTALCGGFAGVNAAITNAQMAGLERSFAEQTANAAGFSALQSQLAQCCCDNRLANCQSNNLISSEAATTRAAIQAQTQAILDKMCQDKIDAKNDEIAQLRSELLYARGQASQDVQTGVIQAGQRALANEVEQYVLPTPRPAYIVANPNCCTSSCGVNCGCGVA